MRRFVLPVAAVLAAIVSCSWAAYEVVKNFDDDRRVPVVVNEQCPFTGREGYHKDDPRCMGARVENGEAVCTSLAVEKLPDSGVQLTMTGIVLNAELLSQEFVVWNMSSPWKVSTLRLSMINPERRQYNVKLTDLGPGFYLALGNVTDSGKKATPPCLGTFVIQ